MPVCKNCGVEIDEGLERCPLCRVPLEREAGEGGEAPLPIGSRRAYGEASKPLTLLRLWEIVSLFAGASAAVVLAVVRALRPRVFAILAVVLVSAGLFVVGLEITISLYLSGAFRPSWSIVVFGCVAPLVGLLLYAQYRVKVTSDDMRKIFHL